ncbi:hypothetical protein HPC49_42350 [Pyxidicoccus fallax]|uniref:Bacterial transcriptional activator domain-containing protein n=1 Tax=Pyxidicoccus fallax TaxID=394095 RepID=A0A848LV77_9BACT|nr:hypothetical protein [Pyxidicoccus fallax]NMO21549.1 hypothetical protein [Pyxidicoccus fallax]NPC84847.1 hypothetical protein [Pyxidicoccus fallax]
MGERELVKLRELKEAAHALFVRGRFVQCAETYARILRLVPKDPNVRVRHAECCRRAGDRQSAITSYREAAALLMEQGCESRARGALRAALELDPRDPILLSDIARLGQPKAQATALEDERLYTGATGLFERLDARANKAGPPPPPPAYVLRAAEETPAPGPLPAAPTIAPLDVKALRGARTMALPPRAHPAVPPAMRRASPSIPPIIPGRLITQPPVPQAPAGTRPAGATVTPVPPAMRPARSTAGVPRAGNATAQAGGPLPLAPAPANGAGASHAAPAATPYRPELRRLGPNAVALRVSPQARWVIIRSDSPLELSRAEALPVPAARQPPAAYAPEQPPAGPTPASS